MKMADYARWKTHQKGKGFSLTELVIVIIIIAILALAVFAGGSAAIRKAKISRAKSDLHNFDVAVQTYMFSNRDPVKLTVLSPKEDFNKYENGTSAESTIFRAVMLHPKNDKGLQLAKERIDAFFASCVDKKNSFDAILDILQKPPFGMRKGVLPFYILDSLLRLENTPTLYLNTKEVVLNVETVNNIVKNPQDYYLYIEMDTVQKNQYIHDLENLFSDYSEYCREVDKRNRLAKISCMMQSWYRSLPQTSKVFTEPDYDEQNIRELTAFRKLFTDLYMNPREILFERIPKIFKTTDYQETYKSVQKAKKDVDSHIFSMKEVAVSIIREVFGFTSESDLRQNLFSWYENLPDTAKKSVFTARTESLLNYIKTIPTGNEDDIAGKIVRETTGGLSQFNTEDDVDALISALESL